MMIGINEADREEAIKVLTEFSEYFKSKTLTAAVDVAVNSLRIKRVSDTIDRKKTLQIIKEWIDNNSSPNDLIKAIENMDLSIYVEQPEKRIYIGEGYYRCNGCGVTAYGKNNFCSYCGVKLEDESLSSGNC